MWTTPTNGVALTTTTNTNNRMLVAYWLEEVNYRYHNIDNIQFLYVKNE